ncbi:hypothetical protein [Achromobacter sp. UMC71]|uniref:hypothetical protein n=1 Tax=Achromobacter sp. UMC71 TaxID=1862320 RepID=UPI00160381C9|nr:hypothetical protein [Achromobacter sp. UMC71]MBB1624452.1 hypothetical protein [Achromobacter sp. UMC71]
MSKPASPRDNRWWENYAVRYLVPTLTGMLFLRWLQLTTDGFFSPMLPAAGNLALPYIFEKLGTPELMVWAGAGFAFAYLASLPILVFHATRSLDVTQPGSSTSISPPALTATLVVLTIGLVLAKHYGDRGLAISVGAVLIAGIFSCFQWRRIRAATRVPFQAAQYARQIAARRSPQSWHASRQWAAEYVTSYRHLREHGNAAFILILQAVLCTLVYLCLTGPEGRSTWPPSESWRLWEAYALCFLLLVIWAAPSVLVHQLSQKLEAGLIAEETSGVVTTPVLPPSEPAIMSPARHTAAPEANRARLMLRALKGISQLSPWLLPLAFCPPILLLRSHLTDVRHPELLMPALSGTTGLGTLLLMGSMVWLLWILSLAIPSILVAFTASHYKPGQVPRRLPALWLLFCFIGIGLSFGMTQHSANVLPTWVVIAACLILPISIGFAVWSAPATPGDAGGNARSGQPGAFEQAFVAFLAALLALLLLLIPLFIVGWAYGSESGNIPLTIWVILFAFLGALLPGITFAWSNRAGTSTDHAPMSMSVFAALLLIPPMLSVILLPAVKQQLGYLTLVTSSITDKGGKYATPQLYRLPDNWSSDDRLLTASFPPLRQCTRGDSSQPKGMGWLCGYRNFSFGNALLVCDKPYADENGKVIEQALSCITFIGNQVTNLSHLPKPRRARQSDPSNPNVDG